ncbi:MAG: helix-turn-helix domain-containing protein [Bacteroidota bacterium]
MFEDTHTIQDIISSLGEMIKSKREELALTQTDLANKTGLNRNTIQKLEYGKNSTLLSLLQVLRYFGLEQEFHKLMKGLLEVSDYPDTLYGE